MTLGGVVISEIKAGSGPQVRPGDLVSILYKLALTSDALERDDLLESNYRPDRPLDIKVSQIDMLKGLYDGIIGMRAGGAIRRIVIPSHLAYGGRRWRAIPPDSPLYLEVLVRLIKTE